MIQQQVLSANGLSLKNRDIQINNPFKDELSIFADEPVKDVELADETGRMALKGKGSKLNTSSLVKGTYFVKITTASGKVISKKAVKN